LGEQIFDHYIYIANIFARDFMLLVCDNFFNNNNFKNENRT